MSKKWPLNVKLNDNFLLGPARENSDYLMSIAIVGANDDH